VPITRAVSKYLKDSPWHRVEAYVEPAFDEAIRWAEMLGFVRETPEPMKNFLPDRSPQYMYAYTKDD
jgi:RimJ/RimL family protein N-acetyltransferase